MHFYEAEQKSEGEFKKEDYAAKAVVSMGCDLSGNCTIPINYYVCRAESGENISEACNTIARELSSCGVSKVIHVMDAGAGNRSFQKYSMTQAIGHWCYVHLIKSGASQLENTKYYPILKKKSTS